MKMRGRTELSEASLILTSVKPELKVGGTLQARTFLAPFGCEEIKVVHGDKEDGSAGTLIIPKFPEGPTMKCKDPQARRRICQKEMTDREEAVKRKNPCNKMQVKLVGKTTGHRQEEYPAWISISSVILRTTRIRWRRLSQQMKAFRLGTSVSLYGNETEFAGDNEFALQKITNKDSSWNPRGEEE